MKWMALMMWILFCRQFCHFLIFQILKILIKTATDIMGTCVYPAKIKILNVSLSPQPLLSPVRVFACLSLTFYSSSSLPFAFSFDKFTVRLTWLFHTIFFRSFCFSSSTFCRCVTCVPFVDFEAIIDPTNLPNLMSTHTHTRRHTYTRTMFWKPSVYRRHRRRHRRRRWQRQTKWNKKKANDDDDVNIELY